MKYLSTFFDVNYLSKGIALYDSIKVNLNEFTLIVLALDNKTEQFFSNRKNSFPNIRIIKIGEIEDYYPELIQLKESRSLIEYYFTLSPYLPLFLLKKYSLPHVCTLDADIYFFSSPNQYFEVLNEFSIVLTPHKYSENNADKRKYGEFNVSFQIFKNDEAALNFLKEWRNKCVDWCFDHFDEIENRFADQLYLNDLVLKFSDNISIINDCVGGLAIWNVENYNIQKRNGKYYSNGEKIIFFHFHNFKFLNEYFAIDGFNEYCVSPAKGLKLLYFEYWTILSRIRRYFNLKDFKNIRNHMGRNVFETILLARSFQYRLLSKVFYINLTRHWLFRQVIKLYTKK